MIRRSSLLVEVAVALAAVVLLGVALTKCGGDGGEPVGALPAPPPPAAEPISIESFELVDGEYVKRREFVVDASASTLEPATDAAAFAATPAAAAPSEAESRHRAKCNPATCGVGRNSTVHAWLDLLLEHEAPDDFEVCILNRATLEIPGVELTVAEGFELIRLLGEGDRVNSREVLGDLLGRDRIRQALVTEGESGAWSLAYLEATWMHVDGVSREVIAEWESAYFARLEELEAEYERGLNGLMLGAYGSPAFLSGSTDAP